MGTFKGTKGEWECKDDYRFVGINFNDPINASTICNVYGSGEEAKANAKLIAAATTLLKYLEGAVSVLRAEGFTEDANFYEQAIKKATE